MIVARVTNDNGRSFNVRLVRKGDRYGLNDCLTHEKDDPLVEWWDATHENDPRFTLGLGQFTSRYYLSTLTGQDAWSRCDHRKGSPGIDLVGHVAEWKVTGQNVMDALAAVERANDKRIQVQRDHEDECITQCPDDPRGCRIGHACWCSDEDQA